MCSRDIKTTICVAFFKTDSAKNPLRDIHLVIVVGPIDRASACQSVDNGLEPGLKLFFAIRLWRKISRCVA